MPSYYQGTHTGQEVDAGLDIILAADRGIDALPEATDADHLLGVENGAAKKVAVSALQRDALEAFVKERKNGDYYERDTLSGTETGNEVKFTMGADRIPMKELTVTVLRGQVQTLSVTVEPETIHINQQIVNGRFSGTSGWSATRGSQSASGGVYTYKVTAVGSAYDENRTQTSANIMWNSLHKFYMTFDVKCSRAGATFRLARTSTNNAIYGTCTDADTWYTFSGVIQPTSTTNTSAWFMWTNAHSLPAAVNDTFSMQNVMIIDLTAIFGAGNEPANASAVRALLPSDYYAYTLDTPLSRLHGQTAYGDYLGETYTIDIPAAAEGADLTWYVTVGKLYDNEGGDIYDVPAKTVPSFLGYNRIFCADVPSDDPSMPDPDYGTVTAAVRLDPTMVYNSIVNSGARSLTALKSVANTEETAEEANEEPVEETVEEPEEEKR